MTDSLVQFEKEMVRGILPNMNLARAYLIRRWRKDGASWRMVAGRTHKDWGKDACWDLPSHQVVGRVLCILAGDYLDDDFEQQLADGD